MRNMAEKSFLLSCSTSNCKLYTCRSKDFIGTKCKIISVVEGGGNMFYYLIYILIVILAINLIHN